MATTAKAQAVRVICTPEQHGPNPKTKPGSLLDLGIGPHGKMALLEFPEGWRRTIDLPTEFDAWHPLFADLPQEEKQRLREHAQAPFVIHENGTRSQPSPLSFTRQVQTMRGRHLQFNYFDVPAQDYGEGAATGYRCAAELLEALALGYGPHISLNHLMEEVAEANKEGFYGVNRRAAAATFMGVVGDALKFFAKQANHRVYLAQRIANAEKYAQDHAERRAIEGAEFVERMKAAKLAKRIASKTAIGRAATPISQALKPEVCT